MVEKLECIVCDAAIKPIDIAVTRKFINRGAEEFFCLNCLVEKLGTTHEEIYGKIIYFKHMGCTLFKDIEL